MKIIQRPGARAGSPPEECSGRSPHPRVCIVPLILFSLGISGAWIGNLTALEPYKPLFIAVTLGFLGYGYWLVYRTPKVCVDGAACAKSLPNRLVKGALWVSAVLVVIALFWNWIAPVVAPILLGL